MDRLRIGIDGYNLAMHRGTGVATYSRALADTLLEAGHGVEGVFGLSVGRSPATRETRFVEALRRHHPKPLNRRDAARLMLKAAAPALKARAFDVPLGGLIARADFPQRLPAFSRLTSVADLFMVANRHFKLHGRFVTLEMENPPEIMHWTYPVPITLKGARNIYTLHDLVPLVLPHTTLDMKPNYRRLVQRCVDEAAHVCTVSEASKHDIVELLHTRSDHVTNTYQTSLPPVVEASEEPFGGPLPGLRPGGYFLFFGAIEPKKNVGRLIEAYRSLRTGTPLVIVGPRAWQSEVELARLPAHGTLDGPAGERIVQIDFLPRAELLRLIRSARAVLFPSLYEGFGLPVLEALQLGAPVLTSTAGSLPEVAGDTAVLVNPLDVAAIAEGMRALDSDETLRRRLSEDGPRQAERFAPEPYLRRLEAMYAHVMATTRPG
ncbi:glycosyltransferase family 4 protein [Sphingomonas sp. PR090111-T3T-6A]|uniref:glycosyltransferase family 4 protein n=1 Tax=Sphingomonas sp. PR090111-T3T-6A TaxID=685778 RepID=UPI000374D637|nr:glycosyltransferase family 1 protein [Sphingomonas sp. PR090111-T3T-6A]